jgi:DNA-binding CsgD family transcriptional regulator
MQDVLASINRAADGQAVFGALVDFAAAHGFDAVCHMAPSPREPERLELINFGFPDEIIRQYHALNLTELDPHPAFLAGKGSVFAFSELRRLPRMDRKIGALMAELAASGLPDGLAIPTYGLRATNCLFCIGMPRTREAVREADRALFQAVAQQAQLRLDQFATQEARVPVLSARELQILRWIAAGKSNTELAIILGISPATVATYVKRLFAKLGVHDRVAAAIAGLRLGLLRGVVPLGVADMMVGLSY